jgi:uncharacterized protein DUF2608
MKVKMKYTYCWLQILLTFACSYLQGETIETYRFEDITKYQDSDTLLILDIDDTLLLPVQTLGNDAWFLYRVQQLNAVGLPPTQAKEKAISEWEAVRHLTKVKIVEEGTEEIIANMQKNKTTIIGLTTQGLALATRTVQQLNSLGIDLSLTAPISDDVFFMNQRGVLFRKGIMFTSGTPKGEALLKLFDQINYYPKRIVFINDKATHLQDVEQSIISKGYDFIGLRYAIGDERVANFRSDITDIQWAYSTFAHILTDEEAEQLLRNTIQ